MVGIERLIRIPNLSTNSLFSTLRLHIGHIPTGMLETTRIRREGYSVRPKYDEFVERYRLLAFSPTARIEAGKITVSKIARIAAVQGFLLGYVNEEFFFVSLL